MRRAGNRDRAADRYVDNLLRHRRPKPFEPTQDDLTTARTAIELLAESPDAHAPSPGFLDDLRRRISALDDEEPVPETPAAQRPAPGRRRFLQAGALTATGAAAGLAAGIGSDRLFATANGPIGTPAVSTQPASTPATTPAPTELSPITGTWQTVAASTDLAEGAVLTFDQGSITGVLRRVSGRVQAVSGTCTHQACRLDLNARRDTLVCPCHGATFTLDGANLTHPHQSNRSLPALPRLAVREVAGHIQVYAPST